MTSPRVSSHPLDRLAKRGLSLLLLLAMLLAGAARVVAAPPPPSGFYGYVTSGGANVPNGTIVSAWINGVQYAQTPTFSSGGQSVYSFDVFGDDPATPGVIEGGKEGDPIVFKVGGVVVPQAGVWHSGANVQLDLTVPAATPEITVISPNVGNVGASLNVAITGANTHFAQGTTAVSFGAGVTVNSVTVASATQLTAAISIAGGATPGSRTVTVTTGGEVVTAVDGFTVQGADVHLYLPVAAGSVGAAVTLPITTPTSLTGKLIFSYYFTATFDSAVMQPTGLATAGTLSAGWSVSETHTAPGVLRVAGYGTDPLAGSGTLLNLLFVVNGVSGESSPLTFVDFQFNDGNPNDVTHNGQFTVQGLQVAGAVAYRSAAAPVADVTLSLAGAGTGAAASSGAGAYQLNASSVGNFTVTPSKARYAGSAITTLDSAYIIQCFLGVRPAGDCPLPASDVNDSGTVNPYDAALIARYVVGKLADPSSRAGEWVFDPANRAYTPLTGNQSGQNFTAHLLGDVTANWPNGAVQAVAAPGAACVRLAPAAAGPGESVVFPLEVQHVPAGEVLAYQFEVAYDPARLSYAGLGLDGTLSAGWSVDDNDASGTLRVGGYSPAALAGDGALLELRFTALAAVSSAQAPALAAFQFNEGQPGYGSCAASTGIYLPLIQR